MPDGALKAFDRLEDKYIALEKKYKRLREKNKQLRAFIKGHIYHEFGKKEG